MGERRLEEREEKEEWQRRREGRGEQEGERGEERGGEEEQKQRANEAKGHWPVISALRSLKQEDYRVQSLPVQHSDSKSARGA